MRKSQLKKFIELQEMNLKREFSLPYLIRPKSGSYVKRSLDKIRKSSIC